MQIIYIYYAYFNYNVIFNITTLLFCSYNINQIVKRSVSKMRLSVSLISIHGFGVLCSLIEFSCCRIDYPVFIYPPSSDVYRFTKLFQLWSEASIASQEFYNVSTFFIRNTSIICRFRVIVIMPKTDYDIQLPGDSFSCPWTQVMRGNLDRTCSSNVSADIHGVTKILTHFFDMWNLAWKTKVFFYLKENRN